ncbi:MAG: permease, partial [Clostridiales Family XIII bacterium]|nr:permease [Clostridiales Family XIII bacterium]
MAIPVHVVTGFLDAGKTSFLNELLSQPVWRDRELVVFRFERGEAAFTAAGAHCTDLLFSKRDLDRRPDWIAERMQECLRDRAVDEIWIEWNGITPFSRLQALLLHPALRDRCKLGKVVHIADVAKLETLLYGTGNALPEQIASCDLAVLRGVYTARGRKRFQRLLRGINPGVRVYGMTQEEAIHRSLLEKKPSPWPPFFLPLALAAALCLFAAPRIEAAAIPVNKIVNVFLGILLQAIPFLLIGVLLSSAIRIFVSRSAVESRFPRSMGFGIPVAILAGFCLPVCDCASIPIFRSLVQKGVPLPAALTFMTATPVINPVVILSTYYAFGGNMRIVIARVCLGLVSAVLIGLVFALRPPKGPILAGGALAGFLCG